MNIIIINRIRTLEQLIIAIVNIVCYPAEDL